VKKAISILGVILVLCVGLVAAAGCSTESGTSDVAAEEAAYTVSANNIYAAYQKNEVAADQKYKDKVIVVTGKITDIGKDIIDSPYLIVGGTGMIDGCQCVFAESAVDQIAKAAKGDQVSVKGTCTGYLGMVEMENCSLQ
jgi:hypothetical protein